MCIRNCSEKHFKQPNETLEKFCELKMSLCFSLFVSQDGKTAEDLASTDQHDSIISLLGKLKKVKNKNYSDSLTVLIIRIYSSVSMQFREEKEKQVCFRGVVDEHVNIFIKQVSINMNYVRQLPGQ